MSGRLDGASVLITGGTGSVGHQLVDALLRDGRCDRIRVLSRSDAKQHAMAGRFRDAVSGGRLDFRMGDIRDRDAVVRSARGFNLIAHAAALKIVPSGEESPMEYVRTNILGTDNIVEAALHLDLDHVVAISTEKASAPASVYGASKLCADRVLLAGDRWRDSARTRFSVLRYGNVFGAPGSVVEVFRRQAAAGGLVVTEPEMTRFTITAGEAMGHALWALGDALGGETIVPKCRSFKVADLAEAVAPGLPIEVIGFRPGEKLHEELVTEGEGPNTFDLSARFAVLPQVDQDSAAAYAGASGGVRVAAGFRYASDDPEVLLSGDELSAMLGDAEREGGA